MKPAPYHYWLAHTSKFSMALGAAMAISLMLWVLADEGALVSDVRVWIYILGASIPVGLIGLILGLMFIWAILGRIAARLQGGPFASGDDVLILKGPHKDTRTTIYEVWEERGQVRVDLGEELRVAVKDVLCIVEVYKLTPNKAVDSTATRVTPPASSLRLGQESRHGQP